MPSYSPVPFFKGGPTRPDGVIPTGAAGGGKVAAPMQPRLPGNRSSFAPLKKRTGAFNVHRKRGTYVMIPPIHFDNEGVARTTRRPSCMDLADRMTSKPCRARMVSTLWSTFSHLIERRPSKRRI